MQKVLPDEIDVPNVKSATLHKPTLTLNGWIPWQNRLQASFKVSHSVATKDFVELMEFMDVQSKFLSGSYVLLYKEQNGPVTASLPNVCLTSFYGCL